MLLSNCIEIVAADHRRISRFAERRERFLEALDWSLLSEEFCRIASMADDLVDDELAEAFLYLDHLESRLAHEGDGEIEMIARFVIPPHLMLSAVPV